MKKSILLLIAAFATLVASAQTKVEINGIWYNLDKSAKQAEVTYKGDDSGDYNEYSGSITIPATVTHNGVAYSVTCIGEHAFCGCELTSITIPESVTSIGEYAFWSCDGLTSITIPESVTSIGIEAFAHCCSNLTAIVVAEGNKVYDSRGGCNAIIETSSNTLIQGCSATIIPASVTSIGSSAFRGCSSLTAITIPESVTSIGEYAFSECNSLKSITLPEGVTSIGERAFWACRSLTAITIPENSQLTSIADGAFSGCSSLKSITIPEGVTSIGDYTIYGCSSLTAITIPKGVKSIGVHAFTHCSSLTSITCEASTPPTLVVDPGSFYGVDKSIPVYVPAGSVEAYKVAEGWSEFTNIRPLGKLVTEIILNQTSATLTEGETLVLTATVTPDDATDKSISWSSSNPSVATVDNTGKVTAVAPGIATITATANDGSRVSASCVVEVLGKCATPTISYVDGEVVFTCETEEVTFISETTENIAGNRNDAKFAVIPTYTITAYATKEKYEDSDEVTFTLCWLPCTKEHKEDEGSNEEGEEEDNSITIPAKPVLISTQGGTITVSGVAAGTAVAAYSTASTELATATATNGTATLTTNLTAGSIAIVKIGKYSIKVAIK